MTTARRWIFIPLFFFLAAGVAGSLIPYDGVRDVDSAVRFSGMSWSNILGTDGLGRSLARRILAGVGVFFFPGIAAMFIAGVAGVLLGAAAGWSGEARGRSSSAAQLLRPILNVAIALPGSLPRFVTVLVACAALGYRPLLIGVVAGLTYAAEIAERVRERTIFCLREEFVESARAHGVSDRRILLVHILYLHCGKMVLKQLCHLWALVILVEACLSYLPGQYGVQEPAASWGNMLQRGSSDILEGHYLPATIPTIAIVGTMILLSRLADRVGGDAR